MVAGYCGPKQSHQQLFPKVKRSQTSSYRPWTRPVILTWWNCWSETKYPCCSLVLLELGRVSTSKINWWTSYRLMNTFLCSLISLLKHLPIRHRYVFIYMINNHISSLFRLLIGVEPGTLRFRVDVTTHYTTAPQLIDYMSQDYLITIIANFYILKKYFFYNILMFTVFFEYFI